jgi:hypothetical protein
MHTDERGHLEAIAVAILHHLQVHPLAADSVAGVAVWWLGPTHKDVPQEQVERALKLLVSRHAVRCLKLEDGTELYSQPVPNWQ